MKVGDTVKFLGSDDPEVPFEEGDTLLLKEEDAEGFLAVPSNKPKSKEAFLVFTSEVGQLDEDEADEAEAAAEVDAAEDEAEAKAKEEAKKKAEEEAKKKETSKKKTTPSKKAPTRKVGSSSSKNKVSPEKEEQKQDQKEDAEDKALFISKDLKAALKGKTPVRAARDLVKDQAKSDYLLGGVLAKIQEDHLYADETDPETGDKFTDDQKGFSAFIEHDLGIKYRKGMWLIDFYNTFAETGISVTKLSKAKYSKVKEILSIVKEDPDLAEEWLEKATEEKFEDLAAEARKTEKKLGIEKKPRGKNASGNKMVKVELKVFNEQAEVVNSAIDRAKELIDFEESDTEEMQVSKAIYHIFSEWSQLNS